MGGGGSSRTSVQNCREESLLAPSALFSPVEGTWRALAVGSVQIANGPGGRFCEGDFVRTCEGMGRPTLLKVHRVKPRSGGG